MIFTGNMPTRVIQLDERALAQAVSGYTTTPKLQSLPFNGDLTKWSGEIKTVKFAPLNATPLVSYCGFDEPTEVKVTPSILASLLAAVI